MFFSRFALITAIISGAIISGAMIVRAEDLASDANDPMKVPSNPSAAWQYNTTLKPYLEIGKRSEKWDAHAIKGLSLTVKNWAGESVDMWNIFQELGEAIRLGCDDPMVLYAYARLYNFVEEYEQGKSLTLHAAAAEAMVNSGYPAIRKAYALERAAKYVERTGFQMSTESRQKIDDYLMRSRGQLAKALEDKDLQIEYAVNLAIDLIAWSVVLRKNAENEYGQLRELFDRKRPGGAVGYLLEGRFYTLWASNPEGDAWSSNVMEEDTWALTRERVARAKQALQRAWELQPENPKAAECMLYITSGLGLSASERQEWFRRAMAANPNSYDAVDAKMTLLEPRWGGRSTDMVTFGRACLERYRTGETDCPQIVLMLVDAHERLAKNSGRIAATKASQDESTDRYWLREDVWPDVKEAYGIVLNKVPNPVYFRSEYAYYCCICHQWSEAREQFKILGDRVCVRPFSTRKKLDEARKSASEAAQVQEKP